MFMLMQIRSGAYSLTNQPLGSIFSWVITKSHRLQIKNPPQQGLVQMWIIILLPLQLLNPLEFLIYFMTLVLLIVPRTLLYERIALHNVPGISSS